MLLTVTLPRINPYMTYALVEEVYPSEGDRLAVGSKLFDVCVDLSRIAPQDCPAISFYRIVLRDRGWLRRLSVAPRDHAQVDEIIAVLSTEPDEPLDGAPSRNARLTVAGILSDPDWVGAGGT